MAHPWILWTIILGYMIFIFLKGVSKVSKIENADDFLVAGRSIGWFALACTMGATVIGGGASGPTSSGCFSLPITFGRPPLFCPYASAPCHVSDLAGSTGSLRPPCLSPPPGRCCTGRHSC